MLQWSVSTMHRKLSRAIGVPQIYTRMSDGVSDGSTIFPVEHVPNCELTNQWTDGWIDGRRYEQMDRHTDEQMNGQTDERTDG